MNRISVLSILVGFVAAAGLASAAQLPYTAGNVSAKGFTRIDFCQADDRLYAFNGLNLYRYNPAGNVFEVVFGGVGSATSYQWDPADFAFLTDSNNTVLPTGQSMKVVFADIVSQSAQVKTALVRNYYSVASRFRLNQIFANGVGAVNNTIYLLNMTGSGSETKIAEISSRNSGAIAFDAADNLYIADFKSLSDNSGLGKVSIYRISRGRLDVFTEDSNFAVLPQLLVRDVILAGSDSMVIDADYNIYMGSYVGIAKIIPTNEPNNFSVVSIDGNIYANPHGFPWPHWRFCGITADIVNGVLYYAKSELNENTYFYGPYELQTLNIEPVLQWPADLDGDGIVDFYDLYLLQEDYLCSGQYLKGDINRDNFVNLKDFAILARQWWNKARWF